MRVQVWVNNTETEKASHERRTFDGPYQIVITALHKQRMWSDNRSDEWRILHRSDVPTLTDAEWYVSPGDGWRLVEDTNG